MKNRITKGIVATSMGVVMVFGGVTPVNAAQQTNTVAAVYAAPSCSNNVSWWQMIWWGALGSNRYWWQCTIAR